MTTGNSKGKASFPALKVQKFDLDSLLGSKNSDDKLDANWSDVEPSVLHSLIWATSYMGGTVQFGVTKNNKAYTVKLYIGKAYDPLYFDGSESGRAEMQALAQAMVEMVAGAS